MSPDSTILPTMLNITAVSYTHLDVYKRQVLKPKLAGKSTSTKGKCVIGTVAGDLHDIGKNLVAMMIESVGFEIVDLGIDVPIANFVEAAADDGVKLVACSALLTTTMESMKATVEALNASEHRNRFKVIVGCLLYTSRCV